MSSPTIIAVGECMLELSATAHNDQLWRLHSGGDTFNTLVYLARMGFSNGYLTALGTDNLSDKMRAEWTNEGVSLDLLLTHPSRNPGLYAINLDEQKERSFTYWRSESAARAMMDCPGFQTASDKAASANFLYITGITLSILKEAGRVKISQLAQKVRANGGEVAFDINYRALGWPDSRSARLAINEFAKYVTIAMPSLEDQEAVFGDATPAETAKRWHMLGVKEVVIKSSDQGSFISQGDDIIGVPPERAIVPRDTTGAGDGFNAGYLAGRVSGLDPIASAKIGNKLAGAIIQQPGAVIPKVMMPIGLPKGS
jgi:2-dehydro-3-deoxygluconokinase